VPDVGDVVAAAPSASRAAPTSPRLSNISPPPSSALGSSNDISVRCSKHYYFELTTGPSVVWVDLTQLSFAVGQPVLALDPNNPELSGDVSAGFRPTLPPF
jgi:hypothetical protein